MHQTGEHHNCVVLLKDPKNCTIKTSWSRTRRVYKVVSETTQTNLQKAGKKREKEGKKGQQREKRNWSQDEGKRKRNPVRMRGWSVNNKNYCYLSQRCFITKSSVKVWCSKVVGRELEFIKIHERQEVDDGWRHMADWLASLDEKIFRLEALRER